MFKNKLVGKRQLQRRIKHQTKLLKNQIDNMKIPLIRSQLDSHSYSGFETVSSNTDLLETSTDKTNFDSDSDVDLEESVDVAIDLKNKLREWVNTYNATRNSTTSLLHILKPVLHFLPIDFRTLMGTPGHTEIVKLNNGNMHYFGIENAISKKCQYGIKENAKKISLQINIDGLPLFKSSSTEFYPILGMFRALKDDSPFTIALFCGNGKPDPLEIYLRNIIDEINSLKERGINYNGKVYTFDIHCFICDAPARSYLRQTVGHTSKLGCEKCHIVGDYENHRIIYAQKNLKLFNPKLDQDFIAEPLPTYIKEKSPLLRANIKMVTQFPIDPMHLLFLGVVKRLLVNYFFATSPVKLSQKIMKEIDDRVFILYEYITSDFPRKCRTFKELRRWKATEFKLFILYTFPVIFYNAVNTIQYRLVLLLHCAIFILTDENLIEKYILVADESLKKFVIESAEVFGRDFVVFNVHNLVHLVDDIKLYGTINQYSCFPFENYMTFLRRTLHSSNNPLQQLHRRIHEHEFFPSEPSIIEQYSKLEPKNLNKKLYNAQGKLISFNCEQLQFKDTCLSIYKPDNCVMLNSKKIYIIKFIRYIEDGYVLGGEPFTYYDDLYSEPLQSSKLNIFYVKKN